MNYRNRALLDLAHKLHDCTNCCVKVLEGLEPAHQNSISAGKGFGIKAHDHRHAALCHRCHAWLDQGTSSAKDPSNLYYPTKEDKAAMWVRAHLRTFDEYFVRGWLEVSKEVW